MGRLPLDCGRGGRSVEAKGGTFVGVGHAGMLE